MRIGFDARLIGALGIGRYIAGLLPALSDLLGNKLAVISRRQDVARVRALTHGRIVLILSDAPPYRIAEQTALLLEVARARLPLVHFPHYNLPIAYPGRFVTTIHDLFSYRFPEIHSGPLPRAVNRILIGNAVRRAAAIITPSEATAAEVAARFPFARGKTVPVAEAADDRFSPVRNPAAESSWLSYYRIKPPYFFYLGQWKSYKNVPLLIEAFREVRRQRPEVQLVLAGQDERYPEIPAAAATLPPGSVVLPGRVADDAVPELYRAATAVVVPSLAEGFGLPVLEAMACGVAVVCSDLPVLHEIAGGIAIFCHPAEPRSFSEGMIAALTRQAGDGLSARSVARAAEFSWRRAAEETVGIYERALAG